MADTVSIPTISRDELYRRITRGEPLVLVETLAPEKFEHAHLPGAVNLPPERLQDLAPSLLPDRHAEIVVYCATPT
jgi:rhodanese-related sulfurtransferase